MTPVDARRCLLWFIVCAAQGSSSFGQTTQTAEADDRCMERPPPEVVAEWRRPAPGSNITVEWAYGNMTCSSLNRCFGLSLQNDVPLTVQLRPVQVQPGVNISFFPSPSMDDMSVFRVEEAAFRSCDFTRGTPITKGPQSGEFAVLEKYLTSGSNYFIANTTNHLYTCEYGLKLNVTIRTADCSDLDQSHLCNNRGRCVANGIQPQYECLCCSGYVGHYCEEVDACTSSPCQNGGVCYHRSRPPTGSAFTCECRLGFYGDLCEHRVGNLCDVSPCANNGTCLGTRDNYTCICASGYTGYHCEVNINNCQTNPCVHGVCVDELGRYQCFCKPGFGGVNCDRQFDECQSNPCRNSGFCVDKQDGYECHCSRGYTGQDCSIKVDLCNPSPCQNSKECIDFGNDFECTCKPGFTGAHCEININECESNPCLNGGICRDSTAGYRCLCPEGMSGTHCEYKRLGLPRLQTPDAVYEDSGFGRLHVNKLYIVAGTLAGALLIALSVLAGCYCKVHETYRIFYRKATGYSRQYNGDSLRHKRDHSARQVATHLGEPRPSIDAILEVSSIGYEENSLNAPLVNSLKPKRV